LSKTTYTVSLVLNTILFKKAKIGNRINKKERSSRKLKKTGKNYQSRFPYINGVATSFAGGGGRHPHHISKESSFPPELPAEEKDAIKKLYLHPEKMIGTNKKSVKKGIQSCLNAVTKP
jgi:hypothetical protein